MISPRGATGTGSPPWTMCEATVAVPWRVDVEEYSREGYVAALQIARHSYRHL